MRRRRLLTGIVVALAAGAAGCGANTATAPTAVVTPVTETWQAGVGPGGTVSRSVTASQSGTVSLTLVGADVGLSIGIGVPRSSNTGCRLTVSMFAGSPNTTIAVPVEAGSYCVAVYDEGHNVIKLATFTAQLTYP